MKFTGRARSLQTHRTSLCMRKSVSLGMKRLLHLFLTALLSVEPDEAPTGMLARGHYDAASKFADDDGHSYLKFEWSFDITKEWK